MSAPTPPDAHGARARSVAKERSRRCPGSPHPPRTGDTRSPWSPPLTPAPAALPRPTPQAPPYMTPQAQRRSLPRPVSGPGSQAPPAASSSTGHRVRHVPRSPRAAGARQSPRSARPTETWLPAVVARPDALRPSPASGKCARGAGAGPRSPRLKREDQNPEGRLHRVESWVLLFIRFLPTSSPTQTHTASENFTVTLICTCSRY